MAKGDGVLWYEAIAPTFLQFLPSLLSFASMLIKLAGLQAAS
jgi:hypothetical protein